ncbi:MAG: exopolysaccharide biosynthesis polyprenyl glycosylphosphotransferase [Myxococcales bacterium]|nr:exopolysaccharide biosynthesis polyprenyl glycosylphosphotransferase [Myxococcales bacterium]
MVHRSKSMERVALAATLAALCASGALIASASRTAGVLALALTLALAIWVLLQKTRRTQPERVLVLGWGPHVARLLQAVAARPELGWQIIRLPEAQSLAAAPESDAEAAWAARIRAHHADRIIVSLHDPHGRLPLSAVLAERARGVPVEDAAMVWERLTGKVDFSALEPHELLFEPGLGSRRLDRAVARLLGVTAAVLGLVFLAPLFPLVALAIRLDSRGPVFFRQARLGLHGKTFELVKFRTMHPAAEPHSEWENDNRGRVTRVGRVLRKLHLDELPQLWNIVRGDMNLVGPRPHPVANARLFRERIPFYALRSLVRPGLTGWAQVHYHYANGLAEETEKVRYDLYYLKHRSAWLDLGLVPATLLSLVRRRKAPGALPLTELTARASR